MSRGNQIAARLLGMKHTLSSLYELSYLIYKYKSEESALLRSNPIRTSEKGKQAEQSQPQRPPMPTQYLLPLALMGRNNTAEQGQATRSTDGDNVSGQSKRVPTPIRAQIGSPRQDLESRDQTPRPSVSQSSSRLQEPVYTPPIRNIHSSATLPWQYNASLGGEYLYNPRTDEIILKNGVRYTRPPRLSKETLSRAAYDVPLPGYQHHRTAQTHSYQLHQGFGRTQPPPHQDQPVVALRSGHPQAAARGQGQYHRPDQIQPRTQPVGPSMNQPIHVTARPNIVPGASNYASPVQTRRYEEFGAGPEQFSDPRTGVQAIVYDNPPTPRDLQREGIVVQRSLVGTPGSAERLFPEYIVRPSGFFCLGRVFLVLWPEAPGGNGSNVNIPAATQERATARGRSGELLISKVLHFVVIREGDKYCIALPITTYSGRGLAQDGVVKSEHALIYTGSNSPQLRPDELPSRGESGMRSQPIRVDPETRMDRLDPLSRIDFGGVHQVSHNVKTKSMGFVSRESIRILQSHFSNVWQVKRQFPSRPAEGHSVGGMGAGIGAGRISDTSDYRLGRIDNEQQDMGEDSNDDDGEEEGCEVTDSENE